MTQNHGDDVYSSKLLYFSLHYDVYDVSTM